jgi:AbrB family looped-hinge helix DNA binding protein
MTIRVSPEGRVELPSEFCAQLGLHAGDALNARLEDDEIVLKRQPLPPQKKFKGRIVNDPITGLPMLSFGPDAPVLTQEQIEEMLADFP